MENENKNPREEAINYVRRELSAAAMFEQLAEECVELAHCAQKQARLIRGENPTTYEMVDLVKDTDEEVADVLVCFELIGLQPNQALMTAKMDRWANRIATIANMRNGQQQVLEEIRQADENHEENGEDEADD